MKTKLFFLTLVLLATGGSLFAQSTTVSGQVTDAGAQAWNNGTFTAQFVPNPQFPTISSYTWTGGTLNQTISGTMNGTGGYTGLSIPSNSAITPQGSHWQFSFCPQASSPCFSTSTLTITGGTQTVNATPPVIAIQLSNPPGPFTQAYADAEIVSTPLGGQYYNTTSSQLRVCTAVSGNSCTTWGGSGSSSASSQGPVINVTNSTYTGCPATADWSTCFASVVTAANAAAKVSVGTPTIRSVVATPMATSTITSATAAVNIQAGDTVLVGILASGAVGIQFTVTDPGGNVYSLANLSTGNTGSVVPLWIMSTGVGAAKAASGTMTVTCTSGANFFGFIVLDAFNVGSFGQRNIFNQATSTTPANTTPTTTATQDNNNIVVSFLEYCGGGATTTLSQNTGTLQASWNGTAIICGGGLVTNTSASPATLTTSATISASEPWVMTTIELRSVQVTVPTIYLPYSGAPYNYSSGLNLTVPVTLKGEPGSALCYNGPAHAIDVGPNNLTSANFQGRDYYTFDGLSFQCGGSMTQGVFLNNWILFVQFKNNQFLNFGNASAAGIWANGNQNDLYLTGNAYVINDGAQSSGFPGTTGINRQWVNMTTNSSNSTLRMENNAAVCYSGVFGNVGCSATFGTTPAMISTFGATHIITGNNFQGGFCPFIQLLNGDVNTKIEANHFETDAATCPAISFQTGVVALHVVHNYYRSSAGALLQAASGTDLLVNAEVSNNFILGLPAANPLVLLNNLAGQTGNFAQHNMCAPVAVSGLVPCPLLHTNGGNISQWNGDYSGTCTLTTGACPAFNFQGTYAVAPKCTASWNGTGTFTGILKVASSTTQLTITDTVSESTGVVNWSCNPDAQ